MFLCASVVIFGTIATPVWAEKSEPGNVYLFPAGGQRETTVTAALEGENVTTLCDFHVASGTRGVNADASARARKVQFRLAPDAPLGSFRWRIATAQGGAAGRWFVVGDLPEVLEQEPGVASTAVQAVPLPVTVNGRINPVGDVDRFRVTLKAGQPFSAEVVAARLGGPIDTNVFVGQFGNPSDDVTYKQLDASLAVFGPDGRAVADAEDTFGLDPAVGFIAPKDGTYTIVVHHLAHLGMPQFVYRLTLAARPLVTAVFPAGGRRGQTVPVRLTGEALPEAGRSTEVAIPADGAAAAAPGALPVTLAGGDLDEETESEPNDTPAAANAVAGPALLNGRFLRAGDVDTYRLALRKGQTWRFEAWVERLGSPTDAALAVCDAQGKVLQANDDGVGRDPLLFFTAPADGDYLLQLRDGAASRLGERLVYRLEAAPQGPDFTAQAAVESVDLLPGASAEITIALTRLGGFAGPVAFSVVGLPDTITAAPFELKAGQAQGKLKLTARAGAPWGSWPVRLTATAAIDGTPVTRPVAVSASNPAEPALGAPPRTVEELLVTLRFPTPFKIEADDSYHFLNLGTLYPARIVVTRDPGFAAPLLFSMADRQPRNPYGIAFEPMWVRGLEKEVFFPMRLPQGPRGNEIVRVYTRAEAVTRDTTGREVHLLQTSVKQVVSRTQAPILSLAVEPEVLRAAPGTSPKIIFRLGRTGAAAGAAEVRLVAPGGLRGVRMDPVTISAGEAEGSGTLVLGPDVDPEQAGTLWFEVTSRRDNGYTVFYRARLDLDLRK